MKKIIYHKQGGIIVSMQGWFNIQKLIHVIYHIGKLKKKKNMIISRDAEKAFHKNHSFIIKIISKLWIEGTFLTW